jgi:hypothetical protein
LKLLARFAWLNWFTSLTRRARPWLSPTIFTVITFVLAQTAAITIVVAGPNPLMPPRVASNEGDLVAIGEAAGEKGSPLDGRPSVDDGPDPDLEPGFPVVGTMGGGTRHLGAALNIVVGNVDAEPALEIVLSMQAGGPLMAWNHDGSIQPGWPAALRDPGVSYTSLGELAPQRPGLELVTGHFSSSPARIFAYDGNGNVLPGWPRDSNSYVQAPPSMADVTGDGVDEIFLAESGPYRKLFGYRADATLLPGWPILWDPHWRDTPAIADLDRDGELEIITTNDLGTVIYAYRVDATPLPGFQGTLPNSGFSDMYPVVGDVDGDGALEIVFAYPGTGTEVRIAILSNTGALERTIAAVGQWEFPYESAPALADLDGDNIPEIILLTYHALSVFKGDGTPFQGWPIDLPGVEPLNTAPVVGDIDGDGYPDIAIASADVRAFDRFGRPLPRFPKYIPIGGLTNAVPAIADIDLDGRNELLVTGANEFGPQPILWAYDMHGTGPYGAVQWGQFMGGPTHRGLYHPPGAPPPATPVPIRCEGEVFTDVCPGDYFYTPTLQLQAANIISGYSTTPPCTSYRHIPCFKPFNSITRGQVAKVITLAAGFSEPVSGQTFQDVPPTHTFYTYVERLARRGLIAGYPCGGTGEPCGPGNRPYFRTGSEVTRGQLAKITAGAFNFTEPVSGQTFQDVPPTHTFYAYVERISHRNIISGYLCGGPGEPCGPTNKPYFRPGNPLTRGQTSKIVYGALTAPTSTPTLTPSATNTSTATPTKIPAETATETSIVVITVGPTSTLAMLTETATTTSNHKSTETPSVTPTAANEPIYTMRSPQAPARRP